MANIEDKSFVLPATTKGYTAVSLILKKYELGEIADSVSPEGMNDQRLKFRTRYDSNDFSQVSFIRNGDPALIVKSTYREKWGHFEGSVDVTYPRIYCFTDDNMLEKLSPYIGHPDSMRKNFHITCQGKVSFVKEDNTFRNPNGFASNLKFFEESAADILPLLCGIRTFARANKNKVDIKLNEFGRLRTSANILKDIGVPKKESLNTLFRIIFNMKRKGVSNCKYGPISISYDDPSKASRRLLTIRFAGIEIVREHAINKFRYIFHPGLNLVAYYLEQQEKMMKMYYSVQKQILQKL